MYTLQVDTKDIGMQKKIFPISSPVSYYRQIESTAYAVAVANKDLIA